MGGNQLDAYDPDTGKQLWYLPGLVGGRTVTGPTSADGLVFATRGMKKPMVAVKPEGAGELPEKDIVWQATQNTPDASSPVTWKGLLFWITDNGFAVCRDVKTGDVKWKERHSRRFQGVAGGRRRPHLLPQSGGSVYGCGRVRLSSRSWPSTTSTVIQTLRRRWPMVAFISAPARRFIALGRSKRTHPLPAASASERLVNALACASRLVFPLLRCGVMVIVSAGKQLVMLISPGRDIRHQIKNLLRGQPVQQSLRHQ